MPHLCRNYTEGCMSEAEPGKDLCLCCFIKSTAPVPVKPDLEAEDEMELEIVPAEESLVIEPVTELEATSPVGEEKPVAEAVVECMNVTETMIKEGDKPKPKPIAGAKVVEEIQAGRPKKKLGPNFKGHWDLPSEVRQFLEDHPDGCFLSELAKVIGLEQSAGSLALRGKIKASQGRLVKKRGYNGRMWFVEQNEAWRVSIATCCWLSYPKAAEKLKELRVMINRDTLREYHQKGLLEVSFGKNIFGQDAILISDLSEIAKQWPDVVKERWRKAGKRDWVQMEGELNSEQAHEILREISYKAILVIFGHGLLPVEHRSGRWFVRESAIEQFLLEVESGMHRKKRGNQGLMPYTVEALLRTNERLASERRAA